jgi:hypothetical protein
MKWNQRQVEVLRRQQFKMAISDSLSPRKTKRWLVDNTMHYSRMLQQRRILVETHAKCRMNSVELSRHIAVVHDSEPKH